MRNFSTLFAFSLIISILSFQKVFTQTNPFTKEKGKTPDKSAKPRSFSYETINGKKSSKNTNKYGLNFQKPSTKSEKSGKLGLLELKKNEYEVPIFIKAKLDLSGEKQSYTIENQCLEYLKELKSILKIQKPEDEFRLLNSETDELAQTHSKFQQYFNGIKVYGGEIVVHSHKNQIELLNGRYFPSPQLSNLSPTLDNKKAIDLVKTDLQALKEEFELQSNFKKLFNRQSPQSELVIYHAKNHPEQEKLVWHITIRPSLMTRWEYFVDAHSGEIINKYNHTCNLYHHLDCQEAHYQAFADGPRTANALDLNNVNRTINTYQVGSQFVLFDASRPMFQGTFDDPEGAIVTLDFKNQPNNKDNPSIEYIISNNNAWNNSRGVSAHYNAGKAYEYFKNVHNRNSINGQGGNIVSLINVADGDGSGLDNAFWNGQAIFYGSGNTAFKPLAGSLDVAGHEMTHGVITNSANLEYQGQSGAINESMADVFGVMMDKEDWKIGEDITKTSFIPSGALRDMENPNNGGTNLNSPGFQPKNMSQYYNGSEDNGGVHINSGIPNNAFFLFATATTREKAEKIYYRALTVYLTKSSQFIDLRLAVIQAASDLHGANSPEVTAARNAFNTVGIADGTGGQGGDDDLELNPGQDFILSLDVSTSDPATLYVSSTSGSNFVAKSNTNIKSKPSVTDDGSVALFVSIDNKIRVINLSGNVNERFLSEETIWDNVAISKDGKKLAAITTDEENIIYVYSFEKQQWKAFELYNPTFTQGLSTGEVLYADALEWDYTGEYLMYDAYNKLNSVNGQPIDFWDVGFIKVWDNVTKNFGDGSIEKLFSNLPEGVSIGNPSFSKNSPFIVAFDYFDFDKDEYYLLAVNIETNDLVEVFQNTILSYPNYSKNDNKIIFDALDNSNNEVVAVINMAANKISPSGQASVLIPEAKWGIWYSQGERDLPTPIEDELAKQVKIFPNPTSGLLKFKFENQIPQNFNVAVINTIGKTVLTASANQENSEYNLLLNNLPAGIYLLRIQIGNKYYTSRIVKNN
jgi:Zn-dependent metalloprotease